MYKVHVGKNVDGQWLWCVMSNRRAILKSDPYANKGNAQRAAAEFLDRIEGRLHVRRGK